MSVSPTTIDFTSTTPLPRTGGEWWSRILRLVAEGIFDAVDNKLAQQQEPRPTYPH